MANTIDLIINEINEKLGVKTFYSISELKKIGWVGSSAGALSAIRKDGQIPLIKSSPRRLLVPRYALIEFIRRNMSENIKKDK